MCELRLMRSDEILICCLTLVCQQSNPIYQTAWDLFILFHITELAINDLEVDQLTGTIIVSPECQCSAISYSYVCLGFSTGMSY